MQNAHNEQYGVTDAYQVDNRRKQIILRKTSISLIFLHLQFFSFFIGHDQREIVAAAETLLQEHAGAAANQSALRNDRYTIAEHVGFVHEVSGQYDRMIYR